MSNVIKLRRPVVGVRIGKVVVPVVEEMPTGGESESSSTRDDSRTESPAEDFQTLAALAAAAEYQHGVTVGREEAMRELRAEHDRAMIEEQHRIDTLMISLQEQVTALKTRLEQDAFRFALAVAERIVKREVALDSDVTVRQIREAIQRVVGVESVKLRVHPLDEEILRKNRAHVLQGADSIRDLVIEPDEKIERGGCIIESAAGNVDARLATQLKQIESALFGTAPNV